MNWVSVVTVLGIPGLALLYLILSISMTRVILHSDFFDPWQKRVQLSLIWLLPILGSALAAAVLLPHSPRKREHVPWLELLIFAAFVSSIERAYGSGAQVEGEVSEHGSDDI